MIPRWHILGAGAMGRLMACKLKRLGLEPVLLTRRDTAPILRQRLDRNAEEALFELACQCVADVEPAGIQGLLVTTKANQAVGAVGTVAPALAADAPVILLHNGMGVLERLASDHPRLALYAGSSTEGAYLDGELLVHAGLGDTVVGRQGCPAPRWFAPFADSAERFRWDEDIDAELWRKLLINCAINPLTALYRCRNGSLLDIPTLRAEVELLCEELAAISAARGHRRGASCALDWALAVIQATAGNKSSMLQDVERGRETEIEYITGYLVREAERLGVPCPRNARLLAQVRALDAERAAN